ncbi:MAG: D-alanyl-D-alanine carboxypeptidase [Alphaproteobacteria bacterium]|nr:D-alanyl-D-alanine carboxypeptidase [Alphaproteobacteria bacterium]
MRLLFALLSIHFLTLVPALAQPVADPTTEVQTNAKFALLMDYESGNVLFSKDGDQPMAPASMAKLMTVAILFEKIKHGELKLEDTFTVSERAWRLSVAGKNESSKMFVSIGSQITVSDLLHGIIIQSGNDACTVVAEHFSGSEEAFSDLMNAEAKKIGLTNSVFKNASGLPHPDMHVTAHDLAKLAAYIIREFPEEYAIFSQREFTWNKIKQANRNLLLGTYPGADGLKTGHTQDSGYGMVASAQQDGRRLILVENGLTSEAERASEAKRLLDLGFREYRSYALLKSGDVVGEAQVWAGEARGVPLTVRKPVTLLMRRASRDGLKVKLSYMNPVMSPVVRGAELGKLTITAPGVPEMVVPVYAGADVEAGGLMTQIKVGIKELLSSAPEPEGKSEDLALPVDPKPGDVPTQ